MSLESFKTLNEQRIWEVEIKCSGDANVKVLQRIVGEGNPWCLNTDTQRCDENKFTLSRTLCTAGTTQRQKKSQIAKTKNDTKTIDKKAPSVKNEVVLAKGDALTKRNEYLKEQLQIEEQLIQLEHKRLELVKTELELKKQLEN